MAPIIHDVCLLVGLGLVGAGVFLTWGLGPALVVAGACTLVLTCVEGRG